MADVLLFLAFVFIVGHLITDLRTLRRCLRVNVWLRPVHSLRLKATRDYLVVILGPVAFSVEVMKDGEHKRDAIWTVLTVGFLIGHVITSGETTSWLSLLR